MTRRHGSPPPKAERDGRSGRAAIAEESRQRRITAATRQAPVPGQVRSVSSILGAHGYRRNFGNRRPCRPESPCGNRARLPAPARHIHETAAQLFATDRIRCDPACAVRSAGTRRAYTGTNLPKNHPKARGSLPIHTIHQTGAVRMINFEFRQRTDESALLEKGFLPVSARSDLLPESGRRFRSDEVRLRPQDSDTVPGNVFSYQEEGRCASDTDDTPRPTG